MGTATKKKKAAKTPLGAKLKTTAKKALGLGGGKGGKGRRHKKSALWYEKEVRRLKSKRKYDRERMRV